VNLEQPREFIYAQSAHPDNGSQGTAVKFSMIRHHHLAEWVVAAQDDVAALLSPDVETGSFKGFDTLAT